MARGRPRKTDPDEALEQITRVFWEQGFEGASLGDLTEATGMAKPGLYAAFGDKEAMFAKALTHYFCDMGASLMENLVESPEPLVEVLRRYFVTVVEMARDPHCPSGCFVVNSLVDSGSMPRGLVALSREFDRRRRDAFRKRFRTALESGELPPDADADALADFFSSQVLALAVMVRADTEFDTVMRTIDIALSVLPERPEESRPD
ncbi:TetR/AcrR family transcriptional regulator [Nisaea acidiphila]|uniref:TetR/AcrR family transcriptional regulator n=1 Tax=Nisaea acidiphila TaxID=1862145 RepID=A0A9J7AV89_9PROT|nr:TetR/AcrR family transcriptional regulator [Nisaea acidiphila]UUX50722.1 TetR/AcrR family transcriptional regulator [Nisaea acidiphila]